MTIAIISEEIFEALLKNRLGQFWDRAHAVFHNYGRQMSHEITNILLHALDKEKVDDALTVLEQHFEKHLQYQHSEARGRVRDNLLGTNPTETMFFGIYTETLGLKPTETLEL